MGFMPVLVSVCQESAHFGWIASLMFAVGSCHPTVPATSLVWTEPATTPLASTHVEPYALLSKELQKPVSDT
jgi:hypothetical protein